jgi:hypothetical protein
MQYAVPSSKQEGQMKHFIIAVMLTCMVTPALGADASGNYSVLGHGTKSCGWWTTTRNNGDLQSLDAAIWVGGFITAYNLFTPGVYDITEGTDFEGRNAWIDNYCATNPLDSIADAAAGLMAFLNNR